MERWSGEWRGRVENRTFVFCLSVLSVLSVRFPVPVPSCIGTYGYLRYSRRLKTEDAHTAFSFHSKSLPAIQSYLLTIILRTSHRTQTQRHQQRDIGY